MERRHARVRTLLDQGKSYSEVAAATGYSRVRVIAIGKSFAGKVSAQAS